MTKEKEKESYDLMRYKLINKLSAEQKRHLLNNVIPDPLGGLVKIVYDFGSMIFEPTANVLSAQEKSVAEIIKAGADNGVSEMDITLNQESGFHLKSGSEDNSIKCTLGKSGVQKIKVKYK